MSKRRSTLGRMLGAVAALSLALAGITVAAPPALAATTFQYVNMGDSMSAGEGTYTYSDDNTNTSTNMCHRSPDAYSAQYASSSINSYTLRNVACSGAGTYEISNVRDPNTGLNRDAGEAPQDRALSSSTRLVTITIGINDVDLVGLAQNCYQNNTTHSDEDRCFTTTLPKTFEDNLVGLPNALDTAYNEIRYKAPNALVAVLTYPQIFPTNYTGSCETFPIDLGVSSELVTSQAMLDTARRVVHELDDTIRTAVANRPGFIVVEEENAFDPHGGLAGHDVCSPDPWANHVNVSLIEKTAEDESLHPNVLGYRVLSNILASRLDAGHWPPAGEFENNTDSGIQNDYTAVDGLALLGYPVDNGNGPYVRNISGGLQQDFERGVMYSSSSTSAREVHGAILGKYLTPAVGGPNGILGFPVTNEVAAASGRASYFAGAMCNGGASISGASATSGSAIYWTSATGAHEVQGCIYHEYAATMSGPSGALGFPVTDEVAAASGRASYFASAMCNGGANNAGSAIYWTSATSAHEVQGCIYHEYAATMGGPGGALGFPVTDEGDTAGGRVSYFAGQSCNGGSLNGAGSAIYWHSSFGAHEVQGCIYHEYIAMSGPNGALWFPVSDEQAIAGGRVSYFAGQSCNGGANNAGSAIYWTSATSAHEVQGCIYHEYAATMGGPGGILGFPVADEQAIASGRVGYFAGQSCAGGANGAGSAVFWTGGTGAHEVHGCIYHDYMATMGGPGGTLGFPTSDEQGIASGRVNYFAGTNCTSGSWQGSGSAYFYNGATGTHEVQGCIYQTYVKHLGGPGGVLGFPTSNEQGVTGGRVNTFAGTSCTVGSWQGSGSALYWNSAAGAAYEVQGCIYQRYVQNMGGPGGALGQPISDEQAIGTNGDRVNYFTKGYIGWIKATGQTTVVFYPTS